MENILVTGGAGFIGSNFVRHMVKSHPECRVINYDALTYAGNLENLKDMFEMENYIFLKGDIRDRERLEKVFEEYGIDTVVNFAAETHVDRSIDEPEVFLTTNIIGTQILLDIAKKSWKVDADKYSREYRLGCRYIQISTDEVYGALGSDGCFTEETPLAPNSPYSASKASADMMVRAYHKTYGLPVNITRCSNNYGPYQFPEKLIPLMINNALAGKELPVYGDGKQVRDWLYVEDHCTAIERVLVAGEIGEVYNIGGNSEKENIEIIRNILLALNKSEELIKHVKDRPGHDRRYAIDSTKLRKLGWKPSYSFEEGMEATISWYLENRDWMKRIVDGDYMNYYSRIYGKIL